MEKEARREFQEAIALQSDSWGMVSNYESQLDGGE